MNVNQIRKDDDQRVAGHTACMPTRRRALQGSVLRPVLVAAVIHGLEAMGVHSCQDRRQHWAGRNLWYTGGQGCHPAGRANRSLLKSSKDKCRVLLWEGRAPLHHHRPGTKRCRAALWKGTWSHGTEQGEHEPAVH